MVVLSLFDGMSCCQIALDKLNAKVDTYYASEIDKHAIKVTMANYPNTIQLGSVVGVNALELPKIGLLAGGSPCFVAGTKVMCQNEIKNIEDIVVGDFVLTHLNRFQKVISVGGEKSKETIFIKAQGLIQTETTHDHPFYVRSMTRKWDNERRTSYRDFSSPFWKRAGELKKGDFVGVNILKESENVYNLTDEECYVIGRYIADGHTRKDYRKSEGRLDDRYWQLILSIGDGKVDSFKEKFKDLRFSCYTHTKSVKRCVFSSKRLVEIVEKNCGIGAINKKISMNLLKLPKEKLEILLNGYFDGDGFFQDEKQCLTTISKALIVSISIAIAKVYEVGFQYTYCERPKTHVIEGRTVNQQNTHVLAFKKKVEKQVKFKVIGDTVWLPVKSVINSETNKPVFNIEVENDNSYTANNMIVHNCQSFSFAGKRKGMSTKDNVQILTLDHYLQLKSEGYEFEGQSYLFWEYMRILGEVRVKNPDVKFLLENVVMEKKWERVLTNAIGVEPIMINSALLSAQSRKRLYWSNIGLGNIGLFDGEMGSIIKQPKDKGILLKDILEKEVDEKYYLSDKAIEYLTRAKENRTENVKYNDGSDKTSTLTANYKRGVHNGGETYVKISKNGDVKSNQDKASTFTAGGHSGGNHSDMDLICVAMRGRNPENPSDRTVGANTEQRLEPNNTGKTICLTSVQKDNLILQINPSTESNGVQPYQQNRIYDEDGIAPALCKDKADLLVKTKFNQDAPTSIDKEKHPCLSSEAGGVTRGIGLIENSFRIRRLTPTECEALQTVPRDYTNHVSSSQRYKMLGNGWTVDVIAYILSYANFETK